MLTLSSRTSLIILNQTCLPLQFTALNEDFVCYNIKKQREKSCFFKELYNLFSLEKILIQNVWYKLYEILYNFCLQNIVLRVVFFQQLYKIVNEVQHIDNECMTDQENKYILKLMFIHINSIELIIQYKCCLYVTCGK